MRTVARSKRIPQGHLEDTPSTVMNNQSSVTRSGSIMAERHGRMFLCDEKSMN